MRLPLILAVVALLLAPAGLSAPAWVETPTQLESIYNGSLGVQLNATGSNLTYGSNFPYLTVNQSGYLSNIVVNQTEVGRYTATVWVKDSSSQSNITFTYLIRYSAMDLSYVPIIIIGIMLTAALVLISVKLDKIHEPIRVLFTWLSILSILNLANLGILIARYETLTSNIATTMYVAYYLTCVVNVGVALYYFYYYTRYFLEFLANSAKPVWKKNATKQN